MNNENSNSTYSFEAELKKLEEELTINPADAVELAREARAAGITPDEVNRSTDEEMFSDFEVWCPVYSYPGFEASNLGRIRVGSRIRLGTLARNGYNRQVFRFGPEIRKHLYFHRLCLEAFYGPDCDCCDHLNMDKSDNFLDNLEYVSQGENNKRAAEFYKSIKDKPVIVVDTETFETTVFPNLKKAAHVSGTPVFAALGSAENKRKETKTHYSFTFIPDMRLLFPDKKKKRTKKKSPKLN